MWGGGGGTIHWLGPSSYSFLNLFSWRVQQHQIMTLNISSQPFLDARCACSGCSFVLYLCFSLGSRKPGWGSIFVWHHLCVSVCVCLCLCACGNLVDVPCSCGITCVCRVPHSRAPSLMALHWLHLKITSKITKVNYIEEIYRRIIQPAHLKSIGNELGNNTSLNTASSSKPCDFGLYWLKAVPWNTLRGRTLKK